MIERLSPSHAGNYRALMLEAYAAHPDAFTSSVAERERLPMACMVGGTPECGAFGQAARPRGVPCG